MPPKQPASRYSLEVEVDRVSLVKSALSRADRVLQSVPTTRARNAAFSTNENAAEVRLSPRLFLQSLQLCTPSRRSPNLQDTTLGRTGRVAKSHGLT